MTTQNGAPKMQVEITDFTNKDIDFLSELILEKLSDMGHEPDGGFHFTLWVEFNEANNDENKKT